MRVIIKRGRLLRWRWLVYDARGKFRAISRVWGFSTREQAARDAMQVLGDGCFVDTPDEELYAGPRDWNN